METWAYAAAHFSTQQSTILRIIADSIGVSSSLSVINASVGRGSTDGGFEYFPPLLLVAWIPTMVLIWRFSARLEGGESPMDGDYSSSPAAGNSHS